VIQRESVESVLHRESPGSRVTVYGCIRTARTGKNVVFAALNDGSCSECLQVVFERSGFGNRDLSDLATGACISVMGTVVESPGSEQAVEFSAEEFTLVGPSDGDYPLQKKRHTIEFLRTIPHLRPRTNTFGNIFRARHQLCMAIHRFFDEKGFYYILMQRVRVRPSR